ncbi:hypothetical protein GUJ93_ZPchr0012g19365 [Zizania palustris]|uniref:Uncharacterized protein n=1 Tax=Zizania palustris TaxID=103762 RepID=A0A8J5WMM2_ZIZPA|nr:hypothetical protein GUJ93_ZPchr0012g19365 [Zizania palustris]
MKRFMAMSCRDIAIAEAHQVQLFIASLGKPLRTDVMLQRPTSLDDAVMFAQAFEQHEGVTQRTSSSSATTRTPVRMVPYSQQHSSSPLSGSALSSSVASVAKPASNIRHLSLTEVS